MFELILGISLGIILLFVILLLITEVAATYPVWKQFDNSFSPQISGASQKNRGERNTLKILLLVLTGVGILCLLAYLINERTDSLQTVTPVKEEKTTTPATSKLLAGSMSGLPFHFRLQTKWEGGRMYGNNTISFQRDTAWHFAECRYYLLDKDGFLVKEMIFLPEDFVFETDAAGRVRGLVNKFNTDIGLPEYLKIEKLQVVVDKTIHSLSPE